jgi:hypothetical protein
MLFSETDNDNADDSIYNLSSNYAAQTDRASRDLGQSPVMVRYGHNSPRVDNAANYQAV